MCTPDSGKATPKRGNPLRCPPESPPAAATILAAAAAAPAAIYVDVIPCLRWGGIVGGIGTDASPPLLFESGFFLICVSRSPLNFYINYRYKKVLEFWLKLYSDST